MYKLKYYHLTKNERKELKDEFYKSKLGTNLNKRLTRLLIIGIVGIITSIYMFITSSNKWNMIYSMILFLASLLFIFESFKLRIDKLNNYLIKKNKK